MYVCMYVYIYIYLKALRMSLTVALRDRIHKWRRRAKRHVFMAWGDFSGHVRRVTFNEYKSVCVYTYIYYVILALVNFCSKCTKGADFSDFFSGA